MPDTMRKTSCLILGVVLIGALYASDVSDDSPVFALRLGSSKNAVTANLSGKYILTPLEGTNFWTAKPRSGHDGIYTWHELAFDTDQRLFAVTSHAKEHASIDTVTLTNDLFNALYAAAHPPRNPNDITDLMNTKFLDTRISVHRFALGTLNRQDIVIPLGNDATVSVKIEEENGKAATVHLEYQRAREQ